MEKLWSLGKKAGIAGVMVVSLPVTVPVGFFLSVVGVALAVPVGSAVVGYAVLKTLFGSERRDPDGFVCEPPAFLYETKKTSQDIAKDCESLESEVLPVSGAAWEEIVDSGGEDSVDSDVLPVPQAESPTYAEDINVAEADDSVMEIRKVNGFVDYFEKGNADSSVISSVLEDMEVPVTNFSSDFTADTLQVFCSTAGTCLKATHVECVVEELDAGEDESLEILDASEGAESVVTDSFHTEVVEEMVEDQSLVEEPCSGTELAELQTELHSKFVELQSDSHSDNVEVQTLEDGSVFGKVDHTQELETGVEVDDSEMEAEEDEEEVEENLEVLPILTEISRVSEVGLTEIAGVISEDGTSVKTEDAADGNASEDVHEKTEDGDGDGFETIEDVTDESFLQCKAAPDYFDYVEADEIEAVEEAALPSGFDKNWQEIVPDAEMIDDFPDLAEVSAESAPEKCWKDSEFVEPVQLEITECKSAPVFCDGQASEQPRASKIEGEAGKADQIDDKRKDVCPEQDINDKITQERDELAKSEMKKLGDDGGLGPETESTYPLEAECSAVSETGLSGGDQLEETSDEAEKLLADIEEKIAEEIEQIVREDQRQYQKVGIEEEEDPCRYEQRLEDGADENGVQERVDNPVDTKVFGDGVQGRIIQYQSSKDQVNSDETNGSCPDDKGELLSAGGDKRKQFQADEVYDHENQNSRNEKDYQWMRALLKPSPLISV